ncbi:MAG: riboflavin kinase, partial [Faecousia sp.]
MNKTIYALGFFDGVHIGHAALLRECRALAKRNGCMAGVVTFGSHPDTLVLGNTPRLINTPYDREKLLRERFSMDTVITLPFDEQMRSMPWQDFLTMLVREYNAAGFVCGEDFRFGDKGLGTAQLLYDICRDWGHPGVVVPEQTMDGIRVSSTYIRSQIETGDMATAVRFLGHPHILSGRVIHGHQLGRRLGIPTANLRLPEGLAVPKFGVYACRC